MIDDLPIPPDWLEAVHAWAPSVLAALVLTTALVHLALPVARAIERWAITTPVAWDDGPARRLVEALEWLASALSAVLAWLPRLAVGTGRAAVPPAARSRGFAREVAERYRRDTMRPPPGWAPNTLVQPSTPPPDPPPDPPRTGGPGAGLLILALALSPLLLEGCTDRAPREARVAVEEIAIALDLADELLERRVEIAGTERREQVRDEVARREVLGETPEETADLAMERWEELMRPLTLARTVLRLARGTHEDGSEEGTLLALERVLDAWDAGGADEQDLIGAAACATAALSAVVTGLVRAGMEPPEQLLDGIRWVAAFARGVCPEPPPAAEALTAGATS